MSTDTTEKGLERLICTAMTGSPLDPGTVSPDRAAERPKQYGGTGWIGGDPGDYDREYCVDLVQLRAFLQATQPKVAEALDLDHDSPTRRKFLARLQGEISRVGVIEVLRKGLKDGPHHIDLFYGTPSPGNTAAAERYGLNRFSVTRQLRYSRVETTRALDLALFINGLPVATFELKNSLTKQTVEDAVEQYKRDRDPREKLFEFGRCVVHFAVDDQEVRFCTHLNGKSSWFLPFNLGWNDGAGNPPNPDGLKTAYLWQRILTPEGLTNILEHYAQIVRTKDKKSGKKREVQVWPRFHQLDVVRRLLAHVAQNGVGQRYLIQHSAGSGKTNSIAWTAHQLSTLHAADGKKIFDSVIVVTDRTVLDTQLQDAIKQIDAKTGVVVAIESGSGSKSEKLAKALTAKAPIIVVTIQTFGFVAEKLGSLPDMSFAIIADEAHSSQTGSTANKVKQVLSPEEAAEFDDGGEVDIEALLALQMETRANATNISYFAYTATPKAKTLELFGRAGADGKPQPFHLYSMQQAIEEEFILDVLKNYTPYKVAFKLAHGGQEYDSTAPLVDQSAAVKQLVQWVRLHDFNISQKVRIIVEHFRANVGWRLDGHAKAMVVTGSRKEAVRYKLAFDRYIADTGASDVRALVAFSGEVHDTGAGPDTFSEASMNQGLKGRSLPEAFASDEFQVMLVANKFQTGFDQPLLVAMYVDKKLSGVTAVQTLSRLNRTATGKDFTCVLDFVNDPEVIRESFQPYFRDARLTEVSDPNVVVDLRAKLEAYGIWEWHEVEAAAIAQLLEHGNSAYFAAIEPGRSRFVTRLEQALASHEAAEAEKLYLFRSDLTSFVNAYDFLSQVVNFENTDLERLSIYARGLARLIREEALRVPIDLSGVELVSYSVKKQADASLVLDGDAELSGQKETGTRGPKDPQLVLLEEVVAQLNALFDSTEFSDADFVGFGTHVAGKVREIDRIREQRDANTEKQFLASPDLATAIVTAIVDARDNNGKMADELFGDKEKLAQFVSIIGRLLYRGKDAAA